MPSSSSGVSRSVTRGGFSRRARSASTAIATAMPAFMSKTPGPRTRPSSTRKGIVGERSPGPDRVVVAEQQRTAAALADAGEHGVAARRARPRLGVDVGGAQALDDVVGQGGHGGRVVRRALAHHQGLEVGEEPVGRRSGSPSPRGAQPLHRLRPALQEGDVDVEAEAGRSRDGHRAVRRHLHRAAR